MITYSGVEKVNEIMCQELSNSEYGHLKATWKNSSQSNKAYCPWLKIKDRKHRAATAVREMGIHKMMATLLSLIINN